MATIRELGQGAQKLSHPLKMADGNAAAGVAAVDARIEHGAQTIDMADAAVELTLGEAASGQVRLVSNFVSVDPNSSGASENLKLPAASAFRGPYTIYNSNLAGKDIAIIDQADAAVFTLRGGQTVNIRSNGTSIFADGVSIATYVTEYNVPAAASSSMYVAMQPVRVTNITGRVDTQGSDASAVTASLVKCASGTAPGSGVALHTGTFDLKGTDDTNQVLTLSTVAGALDLSAGDAIVVTYTGTATAAVGSIAVAVVPR